MDNPIISSFIQSGYFGKGILILLLGLSIYVWTLIQSKYFFIKNLEEGTEEFFDIYESSGQNIFQKIQSDDEEIPPPQEIYNYTQEELQRIIDEEERQIDSSDVEAIQIQMVRVINKAKIRLDSGVETLGTITTIAPFLGLLGTVWGVMSAFVGMGRLGNASIAAVAPGLSESLVTTAVGLIVAIPSAVCYNLVKARIHKNIIIWNDFSMDLLGTIQKQFVSPSKDEEIFDGP